MGNWTINVGGHCAMEDMTRIKALTEKFFNRLYTANQSVQVDTLMFSPSSLSGRSDALLVIQGIGSHHNNPSIVGDADVMAGYLVADLESAGLSIVFANLTSGSMTPLVKSLPINP